LLHSQLNKFDDERRHRISSQARFVEPATIARAIIHRSSRRGLQNSLFHLQLIRGFPAASARRGSV